MGAALKKNQDYTLLNYTKWAAWGVIDIETLERMQRRNYINHVREELKLHGLTLECGGSTAARFYRVFRPSADGKKKSEWSITSANIKEEFAELGWHVAMQTKLNNRHEFVLLGPLIESAALKGRIKIGEGSLQSVCKRAVDYIDSGVVPQPKNRHYPD